MLESEVDESDVLWVEELRSDDEETDVLVLMSEVEERDDVLSIDEVGDDALVEDESVTEELDCVVEETEELWEDELLRLVLVEEVTWTEDDDDEEVDDEAVDVELLEVCCFVSRSAWI